MPESVEIPAPVSATQRRPRSSCTTASAASTSGSRLTAPTVPAAATGGWSADDGAGAVQPTRRLGERAGHRGVDGEGLRHLVDGQPLGPGDSHRVDQLAGSGSDDHAADDDAGDAPAEQLDEPVPAALHLGTRVAP